MDGHLEVEDRAVSRKLPSGRINRAHGKAARAAEKDVVVERPAKRCVRKGARAQRSLCVRAGSTSIILMWVGVEAVLRLARGTWLK
jgi:hypothetical protein